MTQISQVDKMDDQDVARLTNCEDSDVGLPALIESIPNSKVFLSSLDSSSRSALSLPTPTDAVSTKRIADDDPEHDSTKRVKASHHPFIPAPITIPASHLFTSLPSLDPDLSDSLLDER